MSAFAQKILQYGLLIVTVNVVGVWGVLWIQQRNVQSLQTSVRSIQNELGIEESSLIAPIEESISDRNKNNNQFQKLETRLEVIEEDQLDVIARLEKLDRQLETMDPSTTRAPTPASSTQSREQIIYLGSGSSSSLDWTTIPGTTVSINTANYPNLDEVYFEAGLSIIGGDAYARLINTTNNTIVYSSSVMHNTSTITWKKAKMNLDQGENSYAVQLRSSSNEIINLSGARIRILSK